MLSVIGEPVTVHVVEDDADVNQAIAMTLGSVGYATKSYRTAEDFLSADIGLEPCCLTIDLLLPGTTGLSLCRELAAREVACAFLVITGYGDVPSAVEAMRLGAVDFLEKPFSRERLVDAVHSAASAARIRFRQMNEAKDVAGRLARLTNRELSILDAICAGLLTKEIAKKFAISTRTVDVHRSRILRKLDIESPTQLAHLISVTMRNSASGAPIRPK